MSPLSPRFQGSPRTYYTKENVSIQLPGDSNSLTSKNTIYTKIVDGIG
jgi:hypothetical protein